MTDRRFTLDTNILIHAIDSGEGNKHSRAREIVERAAQTDCVLAIQALGEFYVTSQRRRLLPAADAAAQVADWMELFATMAPATANTMTAAREAAAARFGYWDAMLLSTADSHGCTTLLSEDMADGVTLGGVTVRNPFRGDRLPDEIEALLTV
ncbi:PIN domain-containing protein [Inquilinus sp. Marseille-Q2685]|uniref:PIN domain-containing protein n=1 Tax=Inquilinus sp. Marseille-Q2685 TaxID=2866581 RepID=UPI001CE3D0ED|nr:PIN domain-containing protein [Inquilinus sp. Marseille-Q2685]